MYSELLKVPFMIRLPKGEGGGRPASAIVQFHDALPTLLEVIGHGNATDAMAGRSFLPVLKGDTDEHRDSMITGYHRGIDRCVRDKTWSYILRPYGEPDELYNLIDDPRETNNLIDQHHDEALRLASAFGDQFRQLRNMPPVDHTQAGSAAKGNASAVVVKGVQGEYEMASSAID
jgi:arylsulfatase A-like enzyme